MYHVRLFILEKMGFGMASIKGGIYSKPQPLLQKICLFHVSETHSPAYACFGPRTQAITHVRGSRATLVILFPKIDFCVFKKLYFPFSHSSNQFDI